MVTRGVRATLPAAVLLLLVALRPSTLDGQHPPPLDRDPRIEQLLTSISEERLKSLVETLAGFGTRHTLSLLDSPTRGIGAARAWIASELRSSSARLEVVIDRHRAKAGGSLPRDADLRNILAILPGRSPRRIYITAHYDSHNLGTLGQIGLNTGRTRYTRSGGVIAGASNDEPLPPGALLPGPDPALDAPGANDNGSGTALTMELARVFASSGIDFDATLVFMLTAGEEQGLLGAAAHAAASKRLGVRIEAVLNNDIVGNVTGGDGVTDAASVRVYSDGPEDSPSRTLAQFVQRTAARYLPAHRVRVMGRRDRFQRNSDHTPFTLAGYPAVVFRESRENAAKQHNSADTADGVSPPYLARNARVNAAAVAALALAPARPVVVNANGRSRLDRLPSGYDARLQWAPSPGAAGYRVFWRTSEQSAWEHDLLVGNVTEFVLPKRSIDDHVFGVAAIGPAGHESPVAVYPN